MDVEKTIETILEMQSNHAEWLHKHEQAIVRIESGLTQLVDVSLSLARTVGQNSAGIKDLREAQATGFKELRDAQASTDYKLNALIDTVDKIVRKNGHEKP
ncbi:MAG TPA: hypothetical protein VFL79_02330 [Terriglobia bacterium]|nr:hypothetical protein [Terriglobia bacterium]